MAVSSQGHILVADTRQYYIRVFDEQGGYLQSLGGEGSGPGEFEQLGSINIGHHADTIYVRDFPRKQYILFHPEEEDYWTYRRSINYEDFDHRDGATPGNVLPTSDGRKILWYGAMYNPAREDPEERVVSLISPDWNMEQEEIIRTPVADAAVHRTNGGIMVSNNVPFGRNPILRIGPDDRLYHLWTEQLEIARFNPEGEPLDTLSYRLPRDPIGSEELNEAIQEMNEDLRDPAREAVPEYKLVALDMHIDSQNRFWVQVAPSRDEGPIWLVLNSEGEPLGRFRLPAELDVHAARHGNLYGTRESEETGLLYIEVYAVGLDEDQLAL